MSGETIGKPQSRLAFALITIRLPEEAPVGARDARRQEVTSEVYNHSPQGGAIAANAAGGSLIMIRVANEMGYCYTGCSNNYWD